MIEQKTTVRKKIAKIVFDRPPLNDMRLLLALALGMAGGVVLGGLMWLIESHRDNPDFPSMYEAPEQAAYIWCAVIVGLLAGFGIGWGWQRETTARIEMVEPPDMGRRRRSTSTAMVRVDTSGRSRY